MIFQAPGTLPPLAPQELPTFTSVLGLTLNNLQSLKDWAELRVWMHFPLVSYADCHLLILISHTQTGWHGVTGRKKKKKTRKESIGAQTGKNEIFFKN